MALNDLLTLELLLAAMVAAVAGFTKGFAGFGGGMIMAPLFSLLLGPVQAIATLTILEVLASLWLLPRALPQTDWRLIGPLGFLTCLFTPIGFYALLTVEPDIMRRVIGTTVLLAALIMLSGWRYTGSTRPLLTGSVGSFAGILMGSTGLGGPPVVLYVLSRPGSSDRARAGIISYFTIALLFLTGMFGWRGIIDVVTLSRCAVLAPLFVLVTFAGSRLYGNANEKLFRRIALGLLVFAGLVAIVS